MTVFIAGSRSIIDLPSEVKNRLNNIIKKNLSIVIGDADGVDTAVQSYLNLEKYKNVVIYTSNGKVRNNIGKWPINIVKVPAGTPSYRFYYVKDKKMAIDADYGFMIWDGISKGTKTNIENLVKENKTVLIYMSNITKFFVVKNISQYYVFLQTIDSCQ